MHKVKYSPNNSKVMEYKEECPNEKCVKGTIWVYSDAFVGPVCGDCKSLLTGKPLMARQAARVLYYNKK